MFEWVREGGEGVGSTDNGLQGVRLVGRMGERVGGTDKKGLQGVCLVGRVGKGGWLGAGSLHGAAPSRGWLPRGGGSLEREYYFFVLSEPGFHQTLYSGRRGL